MAATEANAINAATTGIVGNTGTSFTGTPVTAHNILLGGATSSTLTNVAPSATSGVPVISQGAAADPTFGTAVVAGGGTGVTTLTGLALGSGTSAFTGVTYTAKTSFTPVLQFGGASTGITYTTQFGTYQQIGNLVFFKIDLLLSSKGSATGTATITGLPVTAASDGIATECFLIGVTVSATASNTMTYGEIGAGTTTMTLAQIIATSGAASGLSNTNFVNTSEVRISGFYFA